MSLCGSDFVKGFLQDSGNLKRVAWGLNVGTGRGRTNIKVSCFKCPILDVWGCVGGPMSTRNMDTLKYKVGITFTLHVDL